MQDGALGALQCLKGLLDQLGACLGEYLQGNVVGYPVVLYQVPDELVIVAGGGGEAHLDLLEADIDQLVVEAGFLGRGHGLDQRLVAVAQIDAAPARGSSDLGVGPAPRCHPQRLEGRVFAVVETCHV